MNVQPSQLPSQLDRNFFGLRLSLGFIAAFIAMCISGYAGIYVEALLKDELDKIYPCFDAASRHYNANGFRAPSLLSLNIQMSAYSAVLAFVQILIFDHIRDLFHGFNPFTWLLIFLSAIGGLIIATVIKYTDSLAKVRLCFLTHLNYP